MTELLLVGGGRMGEALLAGWLDADRYEPHDIVVIEPDSERRRALADGYDVRVADSLGVDGWRLSDGTLESGPVGDGTVLAVKPQVVGSVAGLLGARGRRLLSIAAGVTTEAILRQVADVPVVRAMPNTPSLVGAGMSAVCAGPTASADDVAWAKDLLGAVGDVVEVTESQIDAVTGVSGSGPAYLFLVAEALRDAGVRAGLDRALSARLAAQTIEGAGRMLVANPLGADELRGAVTSPGGTTAEAIAALERGGLRAAFFDAVDAAVRRAGGLG